MTTRLTPYLGFSGEARAAMEHYRSVLGGELELTTFAEGGDLEAMGLTADDGDKVMHSALVVEDGVVIMAADTAGSMPGQEANGVVALTGADDPRLRGWWEAMAAEATVEIPLEKAPWGDWFGQLKDRFGVTWMFDFAGD